MDPKPEPVQAPGAPTDTGAQTPPPVDPRPVVDPNSGTTDQPVVPTTPTEQPVVPATPTDQTPAAPDPAINPFAPASDAPTPAPAEGGVDQGGQPQVQTPNTTGQTTG